MDARFIQHSFEAKSLGPRRRARIEQKAKAEQARQKAAGITAVRLHNARLQHHIADMCLKVGMEYVSPGDSNLQGHQLA